MVVPKIFTKFPGKKTVTVLLTAMLLKANATPVVSWELWEIFLDSCTQKQPFADVLQNRCSQKFRNIHRTTSVLESLYNKVAGVKGCGITKKNSNAAFSCEYCKICKNSFFIKHQWWLPLLLYTVEYQ